MSLKKLHENWLTGSYKEDLVFILKVAENNYLRQYVPKDANDRKYLNVRSNAIGYGYDITKNTQTDIKNELKPLVVDSTLPQSQWELRDEKAAAALLDTAIVRYEKAFNDFLNNGKINIALPNSNERTALLSMWYQGSHEYFGSEDSPSNLTRALMSGNRAEESIRHNRMGSDQAN